MCVCVRGCRLDGAAAGAWPHCGLPGPGRVWGRAARRPRHWRHCLGSHLLSARPRPTSRVGMLAPGQPGPGGGSTRSARPRLPSHGLPCWLPASAQPPVRLRCGETEAEATGGLRPQPDRQSWGRPGVVTPLQACSAIRGWGSAPDSPARQGRGPTVQTAQGAVAAQGPRAGAGHSRSPSGPSVSQRPHPSHSLPVFGPLSLGSRCRGRAGRLHLAARSLGRLWGGPLGAVSLVPGPGDLCPGGRRVTVLPCPCWRVSWHPPRADLPGFRLEARRAPTVPTQLCSRPAAQRQGPP